MGGEGAIKSFNDAQCVAGNKRGDCYVYATDLSAGCSCVRRPAVTQECATNFGLTTTLLDRASTKYLVLKNSWFKGWVRRSQTCLHADQGNAGRYSVTGTVR